MRTNILTFTLTTFLLTSCACVTVFFPVTIKSPDAEYELTVRVKEGAYEEELDELEIEFNFCSYSTSLNKCKDKVLVDKSIKIIPYFSGDCVINEIPFIKEYASTFHFGNADFKKTWRNKDNLHIKVNYQVDSLGTILARKSDYLFTKDTDCRFRPMLH